MRVGVLFSGGKDSCYTIMKAREQNFDIEHLITLIPRSDESWLFHHPCIQWTSLQAEAMDLPILTYNITGQGEEEKVELKRHLREVKKRFGIDGIAAGAIASQYQKKRIEETAKYLGMECFTPLWGLDPLQLLHDQLMSGLNPVIVAVAALGLDQKWLGRKLDREAIKELILLKDKYGVNLSGEGGEYETFVLDGPLFKKRLVVRDFHKIWLGDRGRLEDGFAELVEKK
jgi:diphthine-ammonia ligase